MATVYISYKSDDQAIASSLAPLLEQKGTKSGSTRNSSSGPHGGNN
ncbi:MAG TPA: hypothetical protein VFD58_17040 [Blastocatellia bacterium]|nr:hypothetical protein [Blastocatellia bacterium]